VSKVAFGVKAHSGWAALVVLGERGAQLDVVERRRLALVDEAWAKAPYHAAEGLAAGDAEELVGRATAAAYAGAERALASALAERSAQGDEVVACGVLLGTGMPAWSVAEIRSVHMRMHKAEGELYRAALAQGAERVGLRCIGVREKDVEAVAGEALSLAAGERQRRLALAGQRAGPPWARDQKDAALVAWIALRRARRG
jgi:hypothetical protein